MSEDLIKRSDATEAVYKALRTPPLKGVLTDTMSLAIALARDIPTADRPQGEWIEHKWIEYNEEFMLEMPMHNYECSECHSILHEGRKTNFCPNCGARMKGADDES